MSQIFLSISRVAFAIALLATFTSAADSFAQRSSGGGASGGFGGSSLFGGGSSLGGSGGLGGGNFGGGQGSFGGGLGQGIGGQGGGGLGGGGNQLGVNATTQGGNTGFVGRDSQDAQAMFQQMNRNATQFLNQFNQSRNGGGNRGRDANTMQERRPPVRVNLVLGFTPPPRQDGGGLITAQRISASLITKGFTSAGVSIGNRVATLTGQVPTADDRRLIERLASLEPGIDRVVNQLTVETTDAEPIPQGSRSSGSRNSPSF